MTQKQKYQGVKKFTRWLVHQSSHLAWAFSPHVVILTWHAHKITFYGMVRCTVHHLGSHFVKAFSLCVDILTSNWTFSPHMRIFTWCRHFHLMYIYLHAPCHTKIIFFTSCGKIPKKIHKATPILSIRYLWEPPNNKEISHACLSMCKRLNIKGLIYIL